MKNEERFIALRPDLDFSEMLWKLKPTLILILPPKLYTPKMSSAYSICCIYSNQRQTGRRSAVGNVLATDASLTADPGVASSILARSHTFVEIDHEIISTVLLLPSTESFKNGCCQLLAKAYAPSTC